MHKPGLFRCLRYWLKIANLTAMQWARPSSKAFFFCLLLQGILFCLLLLPNTKVDFPTLICNFNLFLVSDRCYTSGGQRGDCTPHDSL